MIDTPICELGFTGRVDRRLGHRLPGGRPT